MILISDVDEELGPRRLEGNLYSAVILLEGVFGNQILSLPSRASKEPESLTLHLTEVYATLELREGSRQGPNVVYHSQAVNPLL